MRFEVEGSSHQPDNPDNLWRLDLLNYSDDLIVMQLHMPLILDVCVFYCEFYEFAPVVYHQTKPPFGRMFCFTNFHPHFMQIQAAFGYGYVWF